MVSREDDITYFARAHFRFEKRRFGIKRRDRRSHFYVIGKTGVGKSTLLETLIREDLAKGEGVAVFDPHGDLVERVRASLPKEREAVYLDLPNPGLSIRFNPLAEVRPDKRPLVAANLVEIFKKIWPDFWGPRLEHVLRNALLALLEIPGSTLADILRLFSDRVFRATVTRRLKNKQVEAFWTGEYERYAPSLRAQVTGPVENKLGAFLADPRVFEFLAGKGESLDVRRLMDSRGVLLANLSRGELGEGPSALVGALLLASIGLAGLGRADTEPEKRPDFYVYLDEFPTFATLSLASMLSELRKYRVNLVLAHQYLSQVEPAVRDAVLGNAGTLVFFRVGAQDAAVLARELSPEFTAEDVVRLPNFTLYLRLMIDSAVSRPFRAELAQIP